MSTQDHQEQNVLAAEFVLGTLDAGQSAQVESQRATDAELDNAINYWEHRLNALGLAQAPVEPPAQVWSQVQSRIHQPANDSSGGQPRAVFPRRFGGAVVVGWAVAASVAALTLAVLLFNTTQVPQPADKPASQAPAYASLLQAEESGLAWLVTADAAPASALQVTAMGTSFSEAWPDRSPELWLLAGDDAPVSLGLVPAHGSAELALSPQLSQELAQLRAGAGGAKLAISEEPKGGSPTGAPTGKVLLVAALNRRSQ